MSNAVRHYRERAHLTQIELANQIGVSVDSIRRWESGLREPRASDIKKLCEVLGCSEAELLNGPRANEVEIRVIIEATNNWEVEKLNLTDSGPSTFSIHIGPSKVGVYVSGKFDGVNDLDDIFARARKAAERALSDQNGYHQELGE
jgi:transcriptional regulator with XRE-family HTH domain